MARPRVARCIGLLTSVGVLVACSLWALDPTYTAILKAPWQESWWAVLPDTLPAAVRVWAFWGLATVIVGGLLLRDTTIGAFDAALLGALTPWVASLLLGTLLGPLGLFGPWLCWGLLGLGAASLVSRLPPRPTLSWTPGTRLMALTAAIVLPALLLEQLGSPIPPHFDVFAPLAAAQRIVTFGYLPFDNDPYGYYGRAAGTPGVDLFYAMLTLGSGVSTATLGASAAIVPMAALLILSTYRLGTTLAGDRCGGFATLLLIGTVMFRVLPYAHGRYIAFVPALAGLAYVVDQHPLRRIAGGLLLATAVACHAIIGSFSMATALVGGLPFVVGASLVALPTALVAVGPPLPPLVLSAVHAIGVILLVVAARVWPARDASRATVFLGRGTLLALAALLVFYRPATVPPGGFVECWRFPVVLPLAAVGALVMACTQAPARRLFLTASCVVGLGAAVAGSQVSIPGLPWVAHDFIAKAYFWVPVALCFPAAAGLAWLSRWSVVAVTLPLVGLLVVPWVSPVATALAQPECASAAVRDPNYNAISWSEALAEHLQFAKGGYWHPRWATTPAERSLYEMLRTEVAAGRITSATHIVHLRPYIYLYQDTVIFSVFVGINDDLFIAGYHPDPSILGGRIRPIEEAAAAIVTRRPTYVVIHERTHSGQALEPEVVAALPVTGYEVLMDEDGVRLLRWRGV